MKIDQNIQRIATGVKINKAADDAAGLAISEKLNALDKGIEKGTQNANQTIDALNTAESALSGIQENLQRIRELALQAASGILTKDDKQIIQTEIESLKQGITDQVKGTEFNTKPLLDGSFNNIGSGATANGQGPTVGVNNSSLSALGIKDFNVTGSFDLEDIDQAIKQVSENRSKIGAQTNGLDRTVASNQIAQENTVAARSRINDTDVADEIRRLSSNSILDQYKIQMQKMTQDKERNQLNLVL